MKLALSLAECRIQRVLRVCCFLGALTGEVAVISIGLVIGWQRFLPYGAIAVGVGVLTVFLIARGAGWAVANLIDELSENTASSAQSGRAEGTTPTEMKPRSTREFELLVEQALDTQAARATRKNVYGAAVLGGMIELPLHPSASAVFDLVVDGEFSNGALEWLLAAAIVISVAWLLGIIGAKSAMRNTAIAA